MVENLTIVNKVFYPGNDVPLTPKQLAAEAGPNFRESDYPSRILGNLCKCKNGGEFVLLSPDHPDVIASGGKRYMQCHHCGEWSHL